MPQYDISAIDTVVNPQTPEILKFRPPWGRAISKG